MNLLLDDIMIETDVLVVGAGPAGSTAAKHAALNGANVILIDKKSEIGTPKRCAGGVYESGLKWLGIEPDPRWIAQVIVGGSIFAPDGTTLSVDDEVLPEKGYVLERKVFDKFMAMDAARAGAKIMIKTLATDLRKEETDDGNYYILTCERFGKEFEIKTRIIIAADGPESHIARWTGMTKSIKSKDLMSGAQYEMCNVKCDRNDLIELHMGKFAKGGYAWIFPKGGDIANVGIGISSAHKDKSAIEYLNDFIKSYPPLKDAKAVELNVGGIPIGGLIDNISGDNFLACGDAAGQVDSVTGGGLILGMLGGMCAGKVAGEAISEKDYSANKLKDYDKLFDEKSFGAMHKLDVGRELLDSFTDEDFNNLIQALCELDFTDVGVKDFIKVLFKLSPKLALKFTKLFKIVL